MHQPESLVQEVDSLFSLPDVVTRLNQVVEDPTRSNEDIAEVIAFDPALTTRLLKMVNSAFYGLPARVTSVTQAVAVIGRQEVRNLAFTACMASTFKGIPADLVDMETYWFNSVTCGTLARALAQRCRVVAGETLFLPGLLHAVGRLVFYARRPGEYQNVLAVHEQGERAINEAERRVFGFDHGVLGGALLRHWKLPERLCFVLSNHLMPELASPETLDVAILHVASDMAAGIMPSTQVERYARDYVPTFQRDIWLRLGIEESAIPELLEFAGLQSFNLLHVLNPGALVIV